MKKKSAAKRMPPRTIIRFGAMTIMMEDAKRAREIECYLRGPVPKLSKRARKYLARMAAIGRRMR